MRALCTHLWVFAQFCSGFFSRLIHLLSSLNDGQRGVEEGAGTHYRPLLTAHRPARSPLHPPPSDTRKGPPAEALPAGQTLRPAEYKGWVNSSLAFLSGPTLRAEAETNAGRIPGLCHGAINSSDQQGNNAHS